MYTLQKRKALANYFINIKKVLKTLLTFACKWKKAILLTRYVCFAAAAMVVQAANTL